MDSKHLEDRERVWVAVSAEPLSVERVYAFVSDPAAGSTVLFSGIVRDNSPGRSDVSRLEYEAYGGVVESRIGEIVDEAMERWPILRAAALHRVGSLEVGESAVVVAVSTGHRKDGFPAGQYIIDELKSRAPIWKKEHWPGGAEWVEEGTG